MEGDSMDEQAYTDYLAAIDAAEIMAERPQEQHDPELMWLEDWSA